MAAVGVLIPKLIMSRKGAMMLARQIKEGQALRDSQCIVGIAPDRSEGGRTQRLASRSARAFTLIELLVVVAIISLLISILLPSLRRAKELAILAVCAARLHNLELGLLTYASESDAWLPPSAYRDWGGQSNVLRGPVFDTLVEAGLTGKHWFCPSNESRFAEIYPDVFPRCLRTSVSPGDDLGPYDDLAIGVNYCGGLLPGHQTIGDTHEEVQSPATMNDPPDWALCADLMDIWWDSSTGQTYDTYMGINVNHVKPFGSMVRSPGWLVPVVPSGSNVGYLDGHVEWRGWPDQKPRQVSHPNIEPMATHFW